MRGQRGRNGSCCVPWDQEDQAVLVFILINGRVRIKRSHGSNFCPLGFARSWECAFTVSLRRAKVIQQLNKSFFYRRNMSHLLILHELQKMKRPLVLWGRKSSGDDVIHDLPWWIINCFFTTPVCSLTVWCIQNWKELVKIPSSRFNGTHL